MSKQPLDCPVDFVLINENRARTVAFTVLLLATACLYTNSWLIAAFLLADFLLRTLNLNTYSPLAVVAGLIVKALHIKNKPVDRAPKRFAAFVGLCFMAFIMPMLLLGYLQTAHVATIIIMVFAALESFIGFCAGCYVYTYLKRFGLIK